MFLGGRDVISYNIGSWLKFMNGTIRPHILWRQQFINELKPKTTPREWLAERVNSNGIIHLKGVISSPSYNISIASVLLLTKR